VVVEAATTTETIAIRGEAIAGRREDDG
jgi:hypothetical protein